MTVSALPFNTPVHISADNAQQVIDAIRAATAGNVYRATSHGHASTFLYTVDANIGVHSIMDGQSRPPTPSIMIAVTSLPRTQQGPETDGHTPWRLDITVHLDELDGTPAGQGRPAVTVELRENGIELHATAWLPVSPTADKRLFNDTYLLELADPRT